MTKVVEKEQKAHTAKKNYRILKSEHEAVTVSGREDVNTIYCSRTTEDLLLEAANDRKDYI